MNEARQVMCDTPLPNKCDFCGLRVGFRLLSEADVKASDSEFVQIRRLYDAGVIGKFFSRDMTPDTTSFCAIGSNRWNKPVNCPHWIKKFHGATLPDYLSIHQSEQMIHLAKIGAFIAACAAIFALASLFHG